MELVITNGQAVLADRILADASIVIRDGIIAQILSGADPLLFPDAEVCDAEGMLVLPGMIDIHSDAIEKEIEPRPGASFPLELAVAQLEKKLVSQGFTSVCHSLSFAGGEGVRNDSMAMAVIQQIKKRSWSVIRNLVHLRYEVTNFESLPLVKDLLNSGMVDLFSIMDHSPGQGQYQTAEAYADYLRKTYRTPEPEIRKEVETRIERRQRITTDFLEDLVQTALARGIPVASHDDESVAKLNWARQTGITIAEFPINTATAAEAKKLAMKVIVGAPNIARGGSHNGNLSALDLIKAGYADIICSDYYPGSMLYSVFKVAAGISSLVKAVRMVSLNPAQAIGKDRFLGSIDIGKQADLIIVSRESEYPVVKKTFINGKLVYTCEYWQDKKQAKVG